MCIIANVLIHIVVVYSGQSCPITETKIKVTSSFQWRHNKRDGVSNQKPHDCLLNRSFTTDQRKHQSWPLWGELTGDQWIPRTKGQWRGKCFHLMTPKWIASRIPSLTIDQRKHQSSASLVLMRGIHRWFPAQIASDAENISIWWRHHEIHW